MENPKNANKLHLETIFPAWKQQKILYQVMSLFEVQKMWSYGESTQILKQWREENSPQSSPAPNHVDLML